MIDYEKLAEISRARDEVDEHLSLCGMSMLRGRQDTSHGYLRGAKEILTRLEETIYEKWNPDSPLRFNKYEECLQSTLVCAPFTEECQHESDGGLYLRPEHDITDFKVGDTVKAVNWRMCKKCGEFYR